MPKYFSASSLMAILVFTSVVCSGSDFCQAQWNPGLIRADFDKNSRIQYSPDDPVTRSRLFKLQTGQAGAFYNCDGEEDKRNSPFICWQHSNGDHCHRTFSDVLNWRADRLEIIQRICDGAAGCCSNGKCQSRSGKLFSKSPESCGCQDCVAKANGDVKPESNDPASSVKSAIAKLPAKAKPKTEKPLQPKVGTAGLVAKEPMPLVDRARLAVETATNQRAKETKAKLHDSAPIKRTANLLDRIRSGSTYQR